MKSCDFQIANPLNERRSSCGYTFQLLFLGKLFVDGEQFIETIGLKSLSLHKTAFCTSSEKISQSGVNEKNFSFNCFDRSSCLHHIEESIL